MAQELAGKKAHDKDRTHYEVTIIMKSEVQFKIKISKKLNLLFLKEAVLEKKKRR